MRIKDKDFQLYISEQKLMTAIQQVAEKINSDYKDEKVIFIGVLNGAFMFASELFKKLELVCEITFVKMQSYEDTTSTGKVYELIGLNTSVENQHIIVLEDIVDTGLTLQKLFSMLEHHNPKSIEVATMLYKPDAYMGNTAPKYVGLEIENKFIVGFGLDYNQEGRNTKAIYQIRE